MRVRTHARACVRVHTCACVCACARVCECAYARMFVIICVCVWMRVYAYVCMMIWDMWSMSDGGRRIHDDGRMRYERVRTMYDDEIHT